LAVSINLTKVLTTTGLFNGPGTYSVTTQEAGVAGPYLVRLYEQQTGFKVAEAYSAADGTLTFVALDKNVDLFVISFDNTTTGTIKNAAIADRQRAE
jgi:hypothetical protein